MMFFRKPTVGSRFHEASEPKVSNEQRLRALLENHKVMEKDKLGQIFSPFTRFQARDLAQLTNRNK